MIIIFPALTSSTISSHVLPGICKALEKYLIVYRLDTIIEKAKLESKALATAQRAKEVVGKVGGATVGGMGGYKQEMVVVEQDIPEKEEPEKEEEEKGGGVGKVAIVTPKIDQSISLEPTWILVQLKTGPVVLGVKVITFPVKSDKRLSELILSDRIRYGLDKALQEISRGFVRKILRVLRRWWGRDTGATVTGDPTKDVILSLSKHGEDVFVIMNFIDIPGSEFFGSAKGIKKLFSLGWGSFVITDDVNKKAVFCMKEFKGLCSSVTYANIYASLGKEQHQVYKDAEDVKASASPFFSLSTSVRRLASESVVNDRLEKYLTEI